MQTNAAVMTGGRRRRPVTPSEIILHAFLILVAIWMLVPVLLVVTSSFMHETDINISGYSLFPGQGFTLDAYAQVFKNSSQLLHSYLVTGSVTVIGTALGLCFTIPLGYILTRKDFLLRKQLAFFVFFTMIFAPGLVPTYLMLVGWFHLANTYFVQLTPYLCTGFLVLLAKGMMQSIPFEMIESAKLDGAGELRTFVRIILPTATPAIATVGLFIAISYWNDWFTSYMYIDLSHRNLFSLQYLLVQIQQNIAFLATMSSNYVGVQAQAPMFTARMAMCVLITVPIICVYPFVQKYFKKGLTIGSVKG